jgi:hypothetical protein
MSTGVEVNPMPLVLSITLKPFSPWYGSGICCEKAPNTCGTARTFGVLRLRVPKRLGRSAQDDRYVVVQEERGQTLDTTDIM